METSQQNDMHEIVHSKEADHAFRESFKNMDPLAFTDKGVIHSYVIDDKTIGHNPMGGINVALYVNGDEDLYKSATLNRYNGEGPLEVGGSSNAIKLVDLIEENNKKYGVNPSSLPSDVAMNYAEDIRNPDFPRDEQTHDGIGRNGVKDV